MIAIEAVLTTVNGLRYIIVLQIVIGSLCESQRVDCQVPLMRWLAGWHAHVVVCLTQWRDIQIRVTSPERTRHFALYTEQNYTFYGLLGYLPKFVVRCSKIILP